jgi:hypothetical protein
MEDPFEMLEGLSAPGQRLFGPPGLHTVNVIFIVNKIFACLLNVVLANGILSSGCSGTENPNCENGEEFDQWAPAPGKP